MRVHLNNRNQPIDPNGNVLTPVSVIATKKEVESLEAAGVFAVQQIDGMSVKQLSEIDGIGETTAKKLKKKAAGESDDDE